MPKNVAPPREGTKKSPVRTEEAQTDAAVRTEPIGAEAAPAVDASEATPQSDGAVSTDERTEVVGGRDAQDALIGYAPGWPGSTHRGSRRSSRRCSSR